MTWGGMRGLATIALALSIPQVTATGEPFPGRTYMVVAAAVVLLITLVFAGLSFPTVVGMLGIDDEEERERAQTAQIAKRAYAAALAQIKADDTLPDDVTEALRARFKSLRTQLLAPPTIRRVPNRRRRSRRTAESSSPCRRRRCRPPGRKCSRPATNAAPTRRSPTGCSGASTCRR